MQQAVYAPGNKSQTYQLFIHVTGTSRFCVGSLGLLSFVPGYYVYTGSAKKNLLSRVARHLSAEKKMHWHIDYLLAQKGTRIVDVRFYSSPECVVNQNTAGSFPVPGFGASDCIAGCSSHLCYQGSRPDYPGVF